MHMLVCKIENGKWGTYIREHETVAWSLVHAGHLREAVDASFNFGIDPHKHPWTFTERLAPEVMADLLDAPEQFLGIAELRAYVEVGTDRSLDIMIFAPEGRFDDNPGDRWASMHRPPRQRLWSSGLNSVFRPQALRHAIIQYFAFESDERTSKSFSGGKYGVAKASHLRELWVRPAWRARALCPASFPTFRAGPIVTDEQRARQIAKMPQTRGVVRRQRQAENLARHRAAAAARRAVREQQGEEVR